MTSMVLVLLIAVIVTAALVSTIAWRYAADARRREVARAALLRHAAINEAWDDRISPAIDEPAVPAPAIDVMFAADARPTAAPSQSWIAVGAVCIVVALVAATVAARRGESPAAPATAADVAAAPAPLQAPIALTQLAHARDRSGTLTVSGAVKNPDGATSLDHVMAVVDALDAADHVITTVTTGLEAPVLMAGDATRFVVAIPRATDVARYRVRFRLRDGASIEHRDARAKKELQP